MKFKCYDTCSLLEQAGHLFETDEYSLVITSITLEELENIKNLPINPPFKKKDLGISGAGGNGKENDQDRTKCAENAGDRVTHKYTPFSL